MAACRASFSFFFLAFHNTPVQWSTLANLKALFHLTAVELQYLVFFSPFLTYIMEDSCIFELKGSQIGDLF